MCSMVRFSEDGTDTLRNVERLQFSDQALVVDGSNASPDGVLTIDDDTPTEDGLLTVSAAGVTDEDNVSATNPTGAITGPISFFWQAEVRPGIFEDILIENEGGEVVARDRHDLHAARLRGRPRTARPGRLQGRQRRAGERVLGRDGAG